MTTDGLITLQSSYGPEETVNRLEAEVLSHGMTVFAQIDHAAGAVAAGLSLPPTYLLIFGNAVVGTPLMESRQTMGIDLPLKALVWRDASATTWLSYNDLHRLAERHQLGNETAARIKAMSGALDVIMSKVTAP
jgi:uncharacterized protein (DUF302 family)